jgi:hypothetical protein
MVLDAATLVLDRVELVHPEFFRELVHRDEEIGINDEIRSHNAPFVASLLIGGAGGKKRLAHGTKKPSCFSEGEESTARSKKGARKM